MKAISMTGDSIVLAGSVMPAEQETRRDGLLDGLSKVYLDVLLIPWSE